MPNCYRILFLGTPEFARYQLECLLKMPQFEVVGVVSQPARAQGRKMKIQPSPVEQLARQQGLPIITSPNINKDLDKIQKLKAHAAVVVAFGQLLSSQFLQLFEHRVLNIHASLLPRWRGAAPIQACLAAGDTQTGVCLQQLVQKMDAGPVLGFRSTSLKGDEKAGQIHDTLKLLAPELLAHELSEFLSDRLEAQAQDESLVTFAPKLKKQQAFINWGQPVQQIYNHLRAWSMNGSISTPWPPRAHSLKTPGREASRPPTRAHKPPTEVTSPAATARLKIWQAQPLDQNLKLPFWPGEVVFVGFDFFLIACGRGVLKVLEVQLPSKKPMPVGEFLKGHPLRAGQFL